MDVYSTTLLVTNLGDYSYTFQGCYSDASVGSNFLLFEIINLISPVTIGTCLLFCAVSAGRPYPVCWSREPKVS